MKLRLPQSDRDSSFSSSRKFRPTNEKAAILSDAVSCQFALSFSAATVFGFPSLPDILCLKHDGSNLRQSSNPGCCFSMMDSRDGEVPQMTTSPQSTNPHVWEDLAPGTGPRDRSLLCLSRKKRTTSPIQVLNFRGLV